MGIYADFKHALDDIRKYEHEVANYQCFECDYGSSVFNEKLTRRQIDDNSCPECGESIQYLPERYEDFRIEEFIIRKNPYYKYGFDQGKVIYDCRLKDDGKIEQKFSNMTLRGKYKEVRIVGEPIFIEENGGPGT